MPTRQHGSATAACVVALAVLGCTSSLPLTTSSGSPSAAGTGGGSAAPVSRAPSPEASPTRTTRATRRPTTAPSATATPQLSFKSAVYPFSIHLPADAFRPGPLNVLPPTGTWISARQAWDGASVISPSRPIQNDLTFDSERDELFIVGHATDDDLDAFVARMIGNFATWHGCSPTAESRRTRVDDEPAILVGSSCGRDGVSATAARLFVVHEGFGLIFNVRSFREVSREDLMAKLERYVAEVDLLP